MINYIFDKFAEFKVFFANAGFYVGLINFSMLLATTTLLYGINIPIFVLVPVGMLGLALIGYMDYRYIFPRSSIVANRPNDMKKQLNRIEKLLEQR